MPLRMNGKVQRKMYFCLIWHMFVCLYDCWHGVRFYATGSKNEWWEMMLLCSNNGWDYYLHNQFHLVVVYRPGHCLTYVRMGSIPLYAIAISDHHQKVNNKKSENVIQMARCSKQARKHICPLIVDGLNLSPQSFDVRENQVIHLTWKIELQLSAYQSKTWAQLIVYFLEKKNNLHVSELVNPGSQLV